jgi:hypothetical protein
MSRNAGISKAVDDARQLLKDHGYICQTTEEDLVRWFEADTPFDENFGLDKVIGIPLLVIHELVEIENVKKMGLALTKDVIVKNLEKVDDAHLVATQVELRIAASVGDIDHLRSRLGNIRMWIEEPSVTAENKERYRHLYDETAAAIERLVRSI